MAKSFRVRSRRRAQRVSVGGAVSVAALTTTFGLPVQADYEEGVGPWIKNPWTWIAEDPRTAVNQLAGSRRGKNPLPAFGFASIKGCLVGDKWTKSCEEGVEAPMNCYGYNWGDAAAQKVTVNSGQFASRSNQFASGNKKLTLSSSGNPGTTYLPSFQMKIGSTNPGANLTDQTTGALLVAPKIECHGRDCDDSKTSQKIPAGAKLNFVPAGSDDRGRRVQPAQGVKVEVPANFEEEGFSVIWQKYQVEPDLTNFTRALGRAKNNENPGTTKVNYSTQGNWVIETAERTVRIPSRFDYTAVFRRGEATDLMVNVVPRATSVSVFRIKDK